MNTGTRSAFLFGSVDVYCPSLRVVAAAECS